MKTALFSMAALVLSLTFMLPQPAEAKRFGGGGSFGKQKSMPAQQRQAPTQQQQAAQTPRQAATAGQAASGSAKWLGPMAGLAAGGFLAWMIFGEGFEGIQFFDILLVALIIFGLMMFLRARQRQQRTLAYEQGSQTQTRQPHQSMYDPASSASDSDMSKPNEPLVPVIGSGLSDYAQHGVNAPDWFDEASFVEGAKQHFMAIQTAWDRGNAAEIESYCTPELFAELQSLMQQVQAGENHTEVDTLYTQVLDQSLEDGYFVVSLGFSGFIKEDRNEPAHAFNEVWHIRRLAKGEGDWQIAGIQQLNP
ncbi:MAG: Tim44 domain-containing protein [Thiomicrospira sp.]|uniref:Tim44 domain-containing protein n=1 Tax=Thiomicrospira sp. TaxID=935 RepID=UPI0019E98C23|nr:Tim44-like domain-containing protein [Thiomicrospira sp.]MBE0494081.1 Tim44 domain-containing protein [Thiomicrospira sp.]